MKTIFQCKTYTATSPHILNGKCFQTERKRTAVKPPLPSFSRPPEDFKSSSPPTLEPTEPAPPPRQGDMPLEPPTLRPITGEPQSPDWPRKRLRLDQDLSDRRHGREPPASPPPASHADGRAAVNGLPEPGSPPRVSTGGVGRRTSVLFKKAKNGAKLFRERDGPVPNGKGPPGDAPSSAASTPASTPLSTPSKTPQKSPARLTFGEKWTPGPDLSSNAEAEIPNGTLESGEKTVCFET